MAERVELPGGAWLEVRDASTVTERHRREMKLAMIGLSDAAREVLERDGLDEDARKAAFASAANRGDVRLMFEVNDVLAELSVTAWSFDGPCTRESVLNLPSEMYEAVLAAVAPLAMVMLGNKSKFEPNPDPSSPT